MSGKAQIFAIALEKDATVTTVEAHPFCKGNRVRITGVVGMVELNGREFTVNVSTTDVRKFRLVGVNSAEYGVYSHAGYAELAASSTAGTKGDPGASDGADSVQSTRSGRRVRAVTYAQTTERDDRKQQELDESVQAGDVEAPGEVADKCNRCNRVEATRHCLDRQCPENSDLYCQLCFEDHHTGIYSSHESEPIGVQEFDVDDFDETEVNVVSEEGKL